MASKLLSRLRKSRAKDIIQPSTGHDEADISTSTAPALSSPDIEPVTPDSDEIMPTGSVKRKPDVEDLQAAYREAHSTSTYARTNGELMPKLGKRKLAVKLAKKLSKAPLDRVKAVLRREMRPIMKQPTPEQHQGSNPETIPATPEDDSSSYVELLPLTDSDFGSSFSSSLSSTKPFDFIDPTNLPPVLPVQPITPPTTSSSHSSSQISRRVGSGSWFGNQALGLERDVLRKSSGFNFASSCSSGEPSSGRGPPGEDDSESSTTGSGAGGQLCDGATENHAVFAGSRWSIVNEAAGADESFDETFIHHPIPEEDDELSSEYSNYVPRDTASLSQCDAGSNENSREISHEFDGALTTTPDGDHLPNSSVEPISSDPVNEVIRGVSLRDGDMDAESTARLRRHLASPKPSIPIRSPERSTPSTPLSGNSIPDSLKAPSTQVPTILDSPAVAVGHVHSAIAQDGAGSADHASAAGRNYNIPSPVVDAMFENVQDIGSRIVKTSSLAAGVRSTDQGEDAQSRAPQYDSRITQADPGKRSHFASFFGVQQQREIAMHPNKEPPTRPASVGLRDTPSTLPGLGPDLLTVGSGPSPIANNRGHAEGVPNVIDFGSAYLDSDVLNRMSKPRPRTPFVHTKAEKKLLPGKSPAAFDPDESMLVNAPESPQHLDLPPRGLPPNAVDTAARAAALNKQLPTVPIVYPDESPASSYSTESGSQWESAQRDGIIRPIKPSANQFKRYERHGTGSVSGSSDHRRRNSDQPSPRRHRPYHNAEIRDDGVKVFDYTSGEPGESYLNVMGEEVFRCLDGGRICVANRLDIHRDDLTFSSGEIGGRPVYKLESVDDEYFFYDQMPKLFAPSGRYIEVWGDPPRTPADKIYPVDWITQTTPNLGDSKPENESWVTVNGQERHGSFLKKRVQKDRPWTPGHRYDRFKRLEDITEPPPAFDPYKASPVGTPVISEADSDSSSDEDYEVGLSGATGDEIAESVRYSPTLIYQWDRQSSAWYDGAQQFRERRKRLQFLFEYRADFGTKNVEVWPDDPYMRDDIMRAHFEDKSVDENARSDLCKEFHRTLALASVEGDFDVFRVEYNWQLGRVFRKYELSTVQFGHVPDDMPIVRPEPINLAPEQRTQQAIAGWEEEESSSSQGQQPPRPAVHRPQPRRPQPAASQAAEAPLDMFPRLEMFPEYRPLPQVAQPQQPQETEVQGNGTDLDSSHNSQTRTLDFLREPGFQFNLGVWQGVFVNGGAYGCVQIPVQLDSLHAMPDGSVWQFKAKAQMTKSQLQENNGPRARWTRQDAQHLYQAHNMAEREPYAGDDNFMERYERQQQSMRSLSPTRAVPVPRPAPGMPPATVATVNGPVVGDVAELSTSPIRASPVPRPAPAMPPAIVATVNGPMTRGAAEPSTSPARVAPAPRPAPGMPPAIVATVNGPMPRGEAQANFRLTIGAPQRPPTPRQAAGPTYTGVPSQPSTSSSDSSSEVSTPRPARRTIGSPRPIEEMTPMGLTAWDPEPSSSCPISETQTSAETISRDREVSERLQARLEQEEAEQEAYGLDRPDHPLYGQELSEEQMDYYYGPRLEPSRLPPLPDAESAPPNEGDKVDKGKGKAAATPDANTSSSLKGKSTANLPMLDQTFSDYVRNSTAKSHSTLGPNTKTKGKSKGKAEGNIQPTAVNEDEYILRTGPPPSLSEQQPAIKSAEELFAEFEARRRAETAHSPPPGDGIEHSDLARESPFAVLHRSPVLQDRRQRPLDEQILDPLDRSDLDLDSDSSGVQRADQRAEDPDVEMPEREDKEVEMTDISGLGQDDLGLDEDEDEDENGWWE